MTAPAAARGRLFANSSAGGGKIPSEVMERDLSALSAEELLEHADWVRRLAAALVRNPAEADDLAQQVWEVALDRPPRDPGPLRPWLAGVARNLARMRARTTGRRDRRERAAAGQGEEPVPSPEELVERVEAQQLVARFVLELPEEIRTPLILRYCEGCSSADIGRHLGLPAGTVRWRLKQGLDALRARFDREYGGNRRRWSALLAPLALGRTDLVTGAGSGAATIAKGAIAMKTSFKIAAVVAVLLMALFGARELGWLGASPPSTPASASADELVQATSPPTPAPRIAGGHREVAVREDDPRGRLRPGDTPHLATIRIDSRFGPMCATWGEMSFSLQRAAGARRRSRAKG